MNTHLREYPRNYPFTCPHARHQSSWVSQSIPGNVLCLCSNLSQNRCLLLRHFLLLHHPGFKTEKPPQPLVLGICHICLCLRDQFLIYLPFLEFSSSLLSLLNVMVERLGWLNCLGISHFGVGPDTTVLPILRRGDARGKGPVQTVLSFTALPQMSPESSAPPWLTWPRFMQIPNIVCRCPLLLPIPPTMQDTQHFANAHICSPTLSLLSHGHCLLLRSQILCSVPCVPVRLPPKSVLYSLLCSSVVQPKLPTDWWTFEVCHNVHENRKVNMLTLVLENLASRCFWNPHGAPASVESTGSHVGILSLVMLSLACSRLTWKAMSPCKMNC